MAEVMIWLIAVLGVLGIGGACEQWTRPTTMHKDDWASEQRGPIR